MSTKMNFWLRNSRIIRSIALVLIISVGMLALVLSAAAQENTPETPEAPAAPANSWGNPLPEEINYQGQLVDSNGLPQVGSYTMEFSIFSGPPDHDLLYAETQTVSTDQEGLFNLMIGAVQPGLGDALANGEVWLEVKLDDEILAPRQPVGSVAYALYAQHLIGGTGEYSVIGGGFNNDASGAYSTIGGGSGNNAVGIGVTISGGSDNMTETSLGIYEGYYSVIGGGLDNMAVYSYTTISGGYENVAFSENATVGGGNSNTAYSASTTVSGGYNNEAVGEAATVGGGYGNLADGDGSVVAGGIQNDAVSLSVISGGSNNKAYGAYNTIGGGFDNYTNDEYSTISGGQNNRAFFDYATVSGGWDNGATSIGASVGGGSSNEASGIYATVPGGVSNIAAGNGSFAAGVLALANHDYTFVWSSGPEFESTGTQQFLIDAEGGVGMGTNAPQTQLHVLDTIAGTATNISAHVVAIENDAASSPDILALQASTSTNPGSGVNFITFFDASGAIAAIEGNGSGGVAYNTSGADFAEYLPLASSITTDLPPGTVLGLAHGTLEFHTSNAQRVMVVSSAPGFVGNADEAEGNANMALVAFMGQVPVRVRGPVQAGDLLVVSGLNDGTAVAISPAQLSPALANQIVGQALESTSDSGINLINALVGQPNDAFWASRLATTETELAELEARLADLEAAVQQLAGGDNE